MGSVQEEKEGPSLETKTSDDEANEEYREMVRESGKWIGKEFLTEVLSCALKKDTIIVDFEVNAAVGAGENLLSILYRVSVIYTITEFEEQQHIKLIVKSMPAGEQLQEVLNEMRVFKKENAAYIECIPAMHKQLEKYFPEGTTKVAPDSFKCDRENTIIMEDLTETGYKMANRLDQLDFELCKATLITLARFHAVSVKVYEEEPTKIMEATEEFFVENNRQGTGRFLEAGYPVLAQAIESWEKYAKYADDIRQIGENMWNKAMLATKRSKNLNVMNHGDLWVNNVMFKYEDDGSIHSVKLLDFQLARYCSPACDLHYFFATSVQTEVLQNRMFDLITIYHNSLMADLETLEMVVDYPIEMLLDEMKERSAYAFIPLMQVLPMMLSPPSQRTRLEDIDNDDTEFPLMKHFRFSRYQEVCGSFLEHYDSIGYLEEAKKPCGPIETSDDDANEEYMKKVRESGYWIDNDFLTQVLSDTFEKDTAIINFQVNAAVGAGENYLSTLHRVQITYTFQDEEDEQSLSLIVKTFPLSTQVEILAKDLGVFEKEIFIYDECLQAMHWNLKKYFPEGTNLVAPDSYKCLRTNTIIMEDLTVSGYTMACRQDQLDFEHCQMVVKTLARFHALSVRVYHDNPLTIINATVDFYNEENRAGAGTYLETGYPALADIMEQWGEHARYADDIREIGLHMWDKLTYVTRKSEHLNVMNHGDLWINNVMFKYNDDGSLNSAKLVDFQVSRYTSPALDLHYLFASSVQPKLLQAKMFELLETYHEALMDDLATLQMRVDYPVEQLYEDMRDRALYAFGPLVQLTPMILAPPANTADFYDQQDSGEHVMVSHFRYSRYQEVCSIFLEHYETVGYLREAKDRMKPVFEALEAGRANTAKLESQEDYTYDDPVNSDEEKERTENGSTFSRFWRMFVTPLCE